MGNIQDMWGLGGLAHQWMLANPSMGVQMNVSGVPANDDMTIAHMQQWLARLQTENQQLARVLGPEGAGGPSSTEAANRYRQAMQANGQMMDRLRTKIAAMRPAPAPPPGYTPPTEAEVNAAMARMKAGILSPESQAYAERTGAPQPTPTLGNRPGYPMMPPQAAGRPPTSLQGGEEKLQREREGDEPKNTQ